jgi:hypothetical protein
MGGKDNPPPSVISIVHQQIARMFDDLWRETEEIGAKQRNRPFIP